MSEKIDNALGLYMEGIRDGNPAEALNKYIGKRYTQHSTGVANGKEGFLEFFIPFLERTPERDIRVVRALEEGSYVFCIVFQSLNGGEAQWVTMDLFDTDNDGKIIEHWDVIAAYENTVSGEDMVGGLTEPDAVADVEVNKTLVKEYVKTVLTEGHIACLSEFVAEDLIEHASGQAALEQRLSAEGAGHCEMLFKLIGQGDYVVIFTKWHDRQNDHAIFDVYRVADGLISEHWAVSEPILPRDQWNNSGKF